MKTFAPLQKDFYKVGHVHQYPDNTQTIYSNMTARSGKHANIPDSKGVWYVGMQFFVMDYLIEEWNTTFFSKPKEKCVRQYKRIVSKGLGYDVDVSHIEKLHDLGYLPIRIKSLPEGSFVPYGVPMFTIVNTLDDFYWVTNMLETVISDELWLPITSATSYMWYRKNSLKYSELTCEDNSFVPFQNHDFSMRGMQGRHAAAISGFASIAMGSYGTDTIPAIMLAEDYYGATDEDHIAYSVNASEHSSMSAGIGNFDSVDEYFTYKRMLTEVYPSGIVSLVSDTLDFWKVVTETVPRLKDIILSRDGKLVIRGDSGDPVKIICGDESAPIGSPEYKGLIQCLWDTFGGRINGKGFMELDPHIGAIYGDSINTTRQDQILSQLMKKGFASNNVLFGVGSMQYSYVTRDTHGMAIKSTWAKIANKGIPLFKDPKTDDGTKRSARGLLMVTQVGNEYRLVDNVSIDQERHGCLETILEDGKMVKSTTLEEIRKTVDSFL
jgi:nicotinamide phosphoribosyltransferase